MVKKNQYDAIVNATDADTEGELEFQYMIESLGLERMKTERIYLFDITESVIESELMTLNDF
jgi:DNA topoisomerase IA